FKPFPTSGAGPRAATPVVLNDDGGWCWFEGPRALVRRGKLVLGTVAAGRHDSGRRGNIEATVHDLAARSTERVVLHERLQLDDHDSPAFLPLVHGRLLVVYARHGPDNHFFFRLSEPDDPGNGENTLVSCKCCKEDRLRAGRRDHLIALGLSSLTFGGLASRLTEIGHCLKGTPN